MNFHIIYLSVPILASDNNLITSTSFRPEKTNYKKIYLQNINIYL